MYHIPVLLQTAIDYLINPVITAPVIADCTLGGGGYSFEIAKRISDKNGRLICIDKDKNALEYSEKYLKDFEKNITFINANFADLKMILKDLQIAAIDGTVMDLGLSSYQLESEDGFSFMKDTPLDMRAYKKDEMTAADILNEYDKDELKKIFEEYGELRNAEQLSEAIIQRRKRNKFTTTSELTGLIKDTFGIPARHLYDYYAKVFQALRIEVNGEIRNLQKALDDTFEVTGNNGRIVVVSYHSLEDRIVKKFFRKHLQVKEKNKYPKQTGEKSYGKHLKILTKKPVQPEIDEVKANKRARSAKLRAAEVCL